MCVRVHVCVYCVCARMCVRVHVFVRVLCVCVLLCGCTMYGYLTLTTQHQLAKLGGCLTSMQPSFGGLILSHLKLLTAQYENDGS